MLKDMREKRCARCGETKPTDHWPKAATSDGLFPWCRPCKNEYQRERRLDPVNAEALRADTRRRNRKRRQDPAYRACQRARDRVRRMQIRGTRTEMVTIGELRSRDGDDCVLCGEPLAGDVTMEHLTPLSRGGHHVRENLALAHLLCNCRKGGRTMDEWQARELSAGLGGQ